MKPWIQTVSRIMILLIFMVPVKPSEANTNHVMISRVNGRPTILNFDGTHKAVVGKSLSKGDIINVKPGCELDITMNGLVGFRLLEKTRGALIRTLPDDMWLSVFDGNVIFNIADMPAGATLTLETPLAVAAVRGTQFWGRVIYEDEISGEAKATFAVLNGTVTIDIKHTRQTIQLEQGQAIDIAAGDKSVHVREAEAAELDAMQGATDIAVSG